MLKVIQDNPFFTLGVHANAPVKQRMGNISKMKAYAKLNKPLSFALDMPQYLQAPDRSINAIEHAVSLLNMPHELAVHALFWLYNMTPTQQQACDYLAQGNIAQAEALLSINLENFGSYISLATLYFIDNKVSDGISTLNHMIHENTLRQCYFDFLSSINGQPIVMDASAVTEMVYNALITDIPATTLHTVFKDPHSWVINTINTNTSKQLTQYIIGAYIKNIEELLTNNQRDSTISIDQKLQVLQNYQKILNPITDQLKQIEKIVGSQDFDYITIADRVANFLIDLVQNYINDKNLDIDNTSWSLPEKVIAVAQQISNTPNTKNACKEASKKIQQLKNAKEIKQILDVLTPQIKTLNSYTDYDISFHTLLNLVRNIDIQMEKLKNFAQTDSETNEIYLTLQHAVLVGVMNLTIATIKSVHNDTGRTIWQTSGMIQLSHILDIMQHYITPGNYSARQALQELDNLVKDSFMLVVSEINRGNRNYFNIASEDINYLSIKYYGAQ